MYEMIASLTHSFIHISINLTLKLFVSLKYHLLPCFIDSILQETDAAKIIILFTEESQRKNRKKSEISKMSSKIDDQLVPATPTISDKWMD